MQDDDIKEFNSADRMTAIVAAHGEIFGGNAKAVSLTAACNADIDILEAAGASRVSSSGLRSDGTTDRQIAFDALEKYVRKIASNAKTIKKSEPDFDNKFKIKAGSLNSQQLLDAGRAFHNDLTPAAIAKFVEYGFTPSPAGIVSKIDAFEAGRAQQNAGKGGGIAATAETRAAVKRLKANRRLLAEIGKNLIEEAGDAGLLAEWKSACRIERRATRPADPPPSQ